MIFSKFDLGSPIFDLGGKNSKFRLKQVVRGTSGNIPMRYQLNPIKTVGGVRKSTKKRPKNANDPCDLDFDLVTSRSLGCLTLA